MATESLHLLAPAKINLYLRVTGRRHDGYHLLATLMQKVSLYDKLLIERVSEGVTLQCPNSDLPVDGKNIALRAAHLFFSTLRERLPDTYGVRITLEKKIPVAAGLGGGSSDAATVLVGLDKLFRTGCSKPELADMGVQLGADVPFFVYDWPAAWATGIGDELSSAPGLDDVAIIVANPGFPVSTKWVYENLPLTLDEKKINLSNSQSDPSDIVSANPFTLGFFYSKDLRNDLERVTQASFKEVSIIKDKLRAAGAGGTLMSGSGPTVFGIFSLADHAIAEKGCRQLRNTYKQTFLVAPLQEGQRRFLL